MSAVSVLAIVHPSPLALSAAGIISGITLEALKRHQTADIPEFVDREVTLKGNASGKTPSLYGQSKLTVRVSEVLDEKRIPVNFFLKVNVPEREGGLHGEEIIMRAVLRKKRSFTLLPVIEGTTVAGGWLSRSRVFSPVTRGRERLRNALHEHRDNRTTGLLRAISLGERWQVEVKIRDVLKKTGAYHLLAISGVHVGAAILPFLYFGRFCAFAWQRTRPHILRTVFLILSVCAVGTYLCFTGLSASALRATIYFILVGSAILAGRNSSPLSSLSWCVLIIVCFSAVIQPDLSLMLSVLAVTGIVLSGRGLRGEGKDNLLKGMVRITVGAVIFTLPLVVWMAGGVSAIAPLGNIVAGVPFGLFLIPSAVLMDWLTLIPGVPLDPVINLWLKTAHIVLRSTALLADLPFSFQPLSPGGCLAASLAAVTGIFVWRRNKYGMGSGVAIFICTLAVSWGVQSIGDNRSRDDLVISFPKVGQADAAIIRHHGRTVLIDCGPEGSPGRDSPAARALHRLGVRKVDAIFLSHLHPDHVGGLKDILALWPVEVVYLPGWNSGKRGWERVKDMGGADLKIRFLDLDEKVDVAPLRFTVFGPERLEMRFQEPNRGSMQMLLEVDDFSTLFTGDAGWDQVQRSMGRVRGLDLLKIPHHGSKTGFPPVGLDEAVTAIKKCGNFLAVCPSRSPGNRPLPAHEVVHWFVEKGIKIVFTGDVAVNVWYKKGGPRGSGSAFVDNHVWF